MWFNVVSGVLHTLNVHSYSNIKLYIFTISESVKKAKYDEIEEKKPVTVPIPNSYLVM